MIKTTDIYKINNATKAGVIFSSPHSGRKYPIDFNYICDLSELQKTEDAFVDEIFEENSITNGAAFIKANFPRAYVDLNRAENDMNPAEFINGHIDDYFKPTQKAMAGHGVFHTLIRRTIPIYENKLNRNETDIRIKNYHAPYHHALSELINYARNNYGHAILIDCHSMFLSNDKSYDFVLGDLDGKSCDINIRKTIQTTLTEMGYRVAINNPFKGAYIMHRHSNPNMNIHGIQIEINKSLYMDTTRNQKIDFKFNRLINDINKLVNKILQLNL